MRACVTHGEAEMPSHTEPSVTTVHEHEEPNVVTLDVSKWFIPE